MLGLRMLGSFDEAGSSWCPDDGKMDRVVDSDLKMICELTRRSKGLSSLAHQLTADPIDPSWKVV